jgi:outer membrane lipoprotein SlyB
MPDTIVESRDVRQPAPPSCVELLMRVAIIPLLAAMLTLGACVSPSSGKIYSRQEARTAWRVEPGRVTAIEDVTIEGRRSAVGRIGGGFIGYEVGRTVGAGSGRAIAGAVGAVAGAVAGEAAEERLTREKAYEITVKLDNGDTIAVVQAADQTFAVGERVEVLRNGRGGARVSRT